MSRNATTASSSYSMSAGVWRSLMRQNTQSVTAPPRRAAIIPACRAAATPEGAPDGNVSEVQAQDPEERQPREARVYLVPQGVSRPFRPTRPLEPSPEPGFPCLNSRAHMRVSAIILPSNQSCEAGGCSAIQIG